MFYSIVNIYNKCVQNLNSKKIHVIFIKFQFLRYRYPIRFFNYKTSENPINIPICNSDIFTLFRMTELLVSNIF